MPVGRDAWSVLFELSPIFLTGGVAKIVPGSIGGVLPIIALTGIPSVLTLLTSTLSMDDIFAHFVPLTGATMIDQSIAEYPSAAADVLGNATTTNPLRVSYHMLVPAKGRFSYWTKMPTMMALQATLENHNNDGGTYTLLTPSSLYSNCVMRSMRDVTAAQTKQPQAIWQLDFEKPLVTVDDALHGGASVLNNLMTSLTNGSQITGQPSLSGPPNTISLPPPGGTSGPAGPQT
jgi:hypothetical protein